MLGGENSGDPNPAPIVKSRHDSDHDSKHISTPVDNDADKENGEQPSAVFTPVDDNNDADKENWEPPNAILIPEVGWMPHSF
jgi:hypothetical protein